MENKCRKIIGRKIIIGVLAFWFLFILTMISAQASSVVQDYQPSPLSYYSSSIGTYWPAYGKENCLARQDFLVQILPGSCSPAVITTDLLEEQDVPVFCQLTGIKINPLIEVPEITSISFKGKQMPKEIAGIGFHPARAALQTTGSQLLGSPVLNNLGYLVAVVRRQPAENATPDWVEANLTALIQYNAEKALGIGKAGFLSPVLSDDEWRQYYKQYSFWNGKAYLRTLEIGKDSAGPYARIAVYLDASNQLTTVILHAGQTSQEIYLPGYYCSAALKISLQNIISPEVKAKVIIGADEMWLAKGQRFLDDSCWVSDIQPNIVGGGKISISCKDNGPYTLEIDPPTARITITDSANHEIASDDFKVGVELVNGRGIYLGYTGSTENALSTGLRKLGQDFVVLVKPDTVDSEYFNNLNIIVNSILKGKKYSLFRLIENVLKSFNPKADKSTIKWGDAVSCLTGCENSLENGLKQYFGGKAKFQIISSSGTGQGTSFEGYHFTFDRITGSVEKNYNAADFGKLLEKYFKESADAYQKVAEYYGSEKKSQQDSAKADYYGAEALYNAANLARDLKKFKTQEGLLKQIVNEYPDSGIAETAQQELGLMRIHDSAKASAFISTAGLTYYAILEDIEEPGLDDKSVDLLVNGKADTYAENQITQGSISVQEITDEYTSFSYQNKEGTPMPVIKVKQGDSIQLSDYTSGSEEKVSIRVTKINLKKEASVSLTPSIIRAQTEANFTFKIGIEKRAIKLSPEKTQELIDELNTSIAKWEQVVNNLGNLVKTWKGACFAGSAYLTVKNFISNLGSGTGMARTEAMKHWKTVCQGEISEGKYSTFHDCYYKHAAEIDSSVSTFNSIYTDVNKKASDISKAEGVFQETKGVLGTEQYINNTKYLHESQKYIDEYKDLVITSKDGKQQVRAGDIFNSANMEILSEKAYFSTTDVRDTLFNLEVQKACNNKQLTDAVCSDASQKIFDDASQWSKIIAQNKAGVEIENIFKKSGIEGVESMIIEGKGKALSFSDRNIVPESDYSRISNVQVSKGQKVSVFTLSGISYLAVLEPISSSAYSFGNLYEVAGTNGTLNVGNEITGDAKRKILGDLGSSYAEVVSSSQYSNPYKNPEVKFWETGNYKGLPAVLPLGEYASKGWYVATEPYSLGTSSATQAFTEAGQPISFWICNVNGNGLEEWESAGHGDDKPCQMFSMSTGQPLDKFSGLDENTVSDMTRKARQYLLDASKQYGKKAVTVGGKSFTTGKPAVTIPQYECEDFMSPNDCHIMFNLCDPVLCPSSRCDFGGRYPVADVVQTGVIGSLALCLPNAREGIYVPICLTGVHAGLDNFVQIMKATQDCLQENLKTGSNVGICDQIKSIYLCEFFWKQAAPLAKVGIPWLLEQASGKSSHGGGEYLFVQDAWNKAQQSVDYFTNYYGVNAFKAFQSRSTESVGTEVCKAWVSANYPSTSDMFDKLLQPESPTQFYATISETILTEATVPSTSHYKVYFRIYAGKDEGVYYNVYLKGQPQTEYYSQLGEMQVPNAVGYIPVGEQVDRTTDFTGPSGYKELCVRINAQEECGFGQVTTSFAADELKNIYLAEQAANPVTTESECISGSPSLTAAALNLNLQSGVSEAAQPAIYNRGIIRICSTDNPGQTTEPTRWQSVGYCGDSKIKCWLDTISLNQTITDKGILNQTLDDAKKMAAQIDNEGMWGKEKSEAAKSAADTEKAKLTEANGELEKIISKSVDSGKAEQEIEDAIKTAISNYSQIVSKSLFNQEKAAAQTEIAGIYEKIARLVYENKIKALEPEQLPENIKVGAILNASETGFNESIKITETIGTAARAEGADSKLIYIFENGKWKALTKEETAASKEAAAIAEKITEGTLSGVDLNLDSVNQGEFELSEGEKIAIQFDKAKYDISLGEIKVESVIGGSKTTIAITTGDNSVAFTGSSTASRDDMLNNRFTFTGYGKKTAVLDKAGSEKVNVEVISLDVKNQKIGVRLSNGLLKSTSQAISSLFAEKSSSSQEVSPETKINLKKIVIDPGHGGKEEFSGACGPAGSCEKDLMLSIAKKLRDKLANAGFEVALTREADSPNLSLTDRAKKANDENADLFISIHANSRNLCNAPLLGAEGTETYLFCECFAGALTNGAADACQIKNCFRKNEFADKSELIADLIQQKITEAIGTADDGVKGADFAVLQYAKMPAVLVETAYICNSNEEKILDSESGQEKIANAIFDAIEQSS